MLSGRVQLSQLASEEGFINVELLASCYLWLPLTPSPSLLMSSGIFRERSWIFFHFLSFLSSRRVRKMQGFSHYSEETSAVAYLFHPQCKLKELGQHGCCQRHLSVANLWVDLWMLFWNISVATNQCKRANLISTTIDSMHHLVYGG